MRLRFLPLAALLAFASVPAQAEFLDPDWTTFSVKGVEAPDWIAGPNDDNYIGMCTGCTDSLMFEVKVLPDDGTGGRIASGATTAQTFTDLGKANAERLGEPADYYSTEDISYASALGFTTRARGLTGDYSATYQLWSDGQQLIVRVYGKDQDEVERIAAQVYKAAAPRTFQ
jgi:hypothetical protein